MLLKIATIDQLEDRLIRVYLEQHLNNCEIISWVGKFSLFFFNIFFNRECGNRYQ